RVCAHCGDPEHGKPFVVDAPDVSFSVSHSGSMGLFALGRGARVGADVECVQPRPYLDRLAARTFTPDELAAWRQVDDAQQLECFLAAWTAKEAQVKAT